MADTRAPNEVTAPPAAKKAYYRLRLQDSLAKPYRYLALGTCRTNWSSPSSTPYHYHCHHLKLMTTSLHALGYPPSTCRGCCSTA